MVHTQENPKLNTRLAQPDQNPKHVRHTGSPRSVHEVYQAEDARVRATLAHRVSNSADRENLSQEVWLRVLTHLDQFDPGRGSLSNWISGITLNLIRDYYRKMRRGRELPESQLVRGAPLEHSSPLENLSTEHAKNALAPLNLITAQHDTYLARQILAGIPEKHREILEMMYLKDMSIRQISEHLGIPEGTVKSRLSEGLRRARSVQTALAA